MLKGQNWLVGLQGKRGKQGEKGPTGLEGEKVKKPALCYHVTSYDNTLVTNTWLISLVHDHKYFTWPGSVLYVHKTNQSSVGISFV